MDTILHTEVSNRRTLCVRFDVHVLAEQCIDILNTLHECFILNDLFLTSKAKTLEKHHRIVLHVVIEFRIEITEQVTSFKVPYPPHVMGNLIQALQFLGKCRLYGQHLPSGGISVICFNLHIIVCYDKFFFIFIISLYEALRASALRRAIS